MKRALKVIGLGFAILILGPAAFLLATFLFFGLIALSPFFLAWEATRPVEEITSGATSKRSPATPNG